MHKDYSTENSQHGLQKNNHTSLELGKEAASRVNKVDTVYFAFQALQQSSHKKGSHRLWKETSVVDK